MSSHAYNIIKMKKVILSSTCFLNYVLSPSQCYVKGSPQHIKGSPWIQEIVAQYGSGYTYTANGNEESYYLILTS